MSSFEKSPPRKAKSTRPHAMVSNTECPLGCVGGLTTCSVSIHPLTSPHALPLEKVCCSNAYVCSPEFLKKPSNKLSCEIAPALHSKLAAGVSVGT